MPPNEPWFETPRPKSAKQILSDPSELPQDEPFAGSSVELDVHVSQLKPGKESPRHEILHEPPIMPSGESEPRIGAGSTKGLTFGATPVSEEDTPATTIAESLSSDMINGRRLISRAVGDQALLSTIPAGVDIGGPAKYLHSHVSHNLPFELSAEVLHTVEVAGLLLALGSSQQAYSLLSQWWGPVWSNRTESAALAFLVTIVSNMSRAASRPAEVQDVATKVKQLISVHAWSVAPDPREESVLHSHLAILLLRLQQPSDAVRHCEQAWSIIEIWLNQVSPVLEDWRLPLNLLLQCGIKDSTEFRHLLSERWQRRFENPHSRMLKAEFPQDEALRWLFAWCASKLLTADLCLELAEELRAASCQDWNTPTTTPTLGIFLFRHLWDVFTCGSDTVQGRMARVDQCVREVSEKMQISRPDLFAAIATALVNLNKPCQIECSQMGMLDVKPFVCSVQKASELLGARPRSDFIEAFLAAHATVNLNGLATQAVPAGSMQTFVDECPHVPSVLHRREKGIGNTAFRTVSNDPLLNVTPSSSASSGFHIIFSLCGRNI